jgi:adenosine deaminase
LSSGDGNPRQTGSSLSQERLVLKDALGFDDAALLRLDVDSVQAAFIEQSGRRELARRISR